MILERVNCKWRCDAYVCIDFFFFCFENHGCINEDYYGTYAYASQPSFLYYPPSTPEYCSQYNVEAQGVTLAWSIPKGRAKKTSMNYEGPAWLGLL